MWPEGKVHSRQLEKLWLCKRCCQMQTQMSELKATSKDKNHYWLGLLVILISHNDAWHIEQVIKHSPRYFAQGNLAQSTADTHETNMHQPEHQQSDYSPVR